MIKADDLKKKDMSSILNGKCVGKMNISVDDVKMYLLKYNARTQIETYLLMMTLKVSF